MQRIIVLGVVALVIIGGLMALSKSLNLSGTESKQQKQATTESSGD